MKIKIENNGIYFEKYELQGVSVYPNGLVKYEEIFEFIENMCPPAIRTNSDEIIFINAELKSQLKEILVKKGIRIIKREDIWSFILEEFLDTEIDENEKEYSYRILERNGITRKECDLIRENIRKMMMSYNFESCFWEWIYLGLYDVLSASNGILANKKYKKNHKEINSFYRECVRIALMGKEYV
ncbi:MAG: hypothetical protein JW924_04995 [Fusobacteriaceae bacterium]|nr:hypothetical protein [Fusobacteriaceae bacterium]